MSHDEDGEVQNVSPHKLHIRPAHFEGDHSQLRPMWGRHASRTQAHAPRRPNNILRSRRDGEICTKQKPNVTTPRRAALQR